LKLSVEQRRERVGEFRTIPWGCRGMMRIRSMSAARRDPVRATELVAGIFGDDLHAQRVLSLANGAVGVLRAATLSIHAAACRVPLSDPYNE
jgi:hypothetical protein